MKKNLAKKVTLSILAGAMLMSSSVAWAEGEEEIINTTCGNNATIYGGSNYSLAVGEHSIVYGDNSIAIGVSVGKGKEYTQVGANDLMVDNAIAIGSNAKVTGDNSVAIGVGSKAIGWDSVALGYGSIVGNTVTEPVVSVGRGSESGDGPATRSIINVKDIPAGKLTDVTGGKYTYGSYAVNVNTLNDALSGYYTKTEVEDLLQSGGAGGNGGNYVEKEAIDGGGTETKLSDNFVVTDTTVGNSTTTTVTINLNDSNNPIVMDDDGITVGQNSARIDGSGFYVWDGGDHTAENAKASMTKDGKIKAANGAFIVNESGNVTAQDVTANNFIIKGANSSDINIGTKLGELDSKVQTNTTTIATKADISYVDNELGKKANQSDLEAETDERKKADTALEQKIADLGGGNSAAIAGINQRLDKTNAKINKVGAGAAALAALHPLEYDPDDKLTFSAGMGNYAGENAAALGAFYRPNEKFMVSLGGTMGNGENMVNLGLSIGLDKPNGYAKLSKRELIQEVNAVKAENEAIKADNEAMKAEMAEMKAMLQAILAKK